MNHTITLLPRKKIWSVPQGTNLLNALRAAGEAPDAPCGGHGRCGKCKALVNGRERLACEYRITSDVTVQLKEANAPSILTDGAGSLVPPDPMREGYLIAFDIGTTSVVCYLLAPDGSQLAVESMLNPQVSFGADVISRIRQALKGEQEALTRAIRRGMSELVDRCCQKAGIAADAVGVVSVVGNPCMQQLFLGISPENLAAVPFRPVLNRAEVSPAAEYLPACSHGLLLIVPDISGYVGADTMACILASRMYRQRETILLVDIGTNGEMVLAHQGKLAACSTAAGPALEGANIRFGMRGAEGAIDHLWEDAGQLRFSVIGNGTPIGICGSGILDAIALLLDRKILNKRGRIQTAAEKDGQRIVPLTEELYLTQEDIRQVQLAKGAIAAGIHLMCAYFGITPKEIDRVILAGAFGSSLNPDSTCRIDLLPGELTGKIHAAGNLAGTGAKMIALNQEQFSLTQELLQNVTFLELAQLPGFQRVFAKSMEFPE